MSHARTSGQGSALGVDPSAEMVVVPGDPQGLAVCLEPLEPRLMLTAGPIVETVLLNAGLAQRSVISQFDVRFDADVAGSISAGDLRLTRADTGQAIDLGGASFSYSAATRTATWQLPVSAIDQMGDGFYRATLDADGITDGLGRALDGNRDGTGGDDFSFGLFRMAGDTNGDGQVNALDLATVRDNWLQPAGEFDANADLNDDGAVNAFDLRIVSGAWQQSAAPVTLDQARTPAELAAALYYQPQRIYEYILNTVRYEPYTGLMKGPEAALETAAGNAWDQAALLVACLDETGVYSQFVSAQVEVDAEPVRDWLGVTSDDAAGTVLANALPDSVRMLGPGGETRAFRFGHVWVQSLLVGPGGTFEWVQMDPSWKFRDFREGVQDLISLVPFDEADYLSRTRRELTWEYYANQVAAYLAANHPGVSLADVAYDGPIIPQQVTEWSTALPHEVTGAVSTANRIAAERTHRVRLTLTGGGNTHVDELLSLPEMSLQRVTVTWASAGGGQLRAQLRLDGELVAESAYTLATGSSVWLTIQHYDADGDSVADHVDTYDHEAGQVLSVGLDAGQISAEMLQRLRGVVNEANLAATNGQQVTQDEQIGAYLSLGVLGYFYETRQAQNLICGLTEGLGLYDRVASGITSAEPTVQYFADLEFPYRPDALSLDVKNSVFLGISIDGNESTEPLRRRILMHNKSAQEHAIWEELAQTSSMSTIKSLQLAAEQGIPIYEFDSSWSPTLIYMTLNLSASVEDSIVSYVLSGFKVTTPRDQTPLQDWQGVGYLAEYESGGAFEAAYMISGGLHGAAEQTVAGGFIAGLPFFWPPLAFMWPNPFQFNVGDPINVSNGNVVHEDLDVILPGTGLDLEFLRQYNSTVEADVGFGTGWTHSYSDFLAVEQDGSVTWTDSGGMRFTFSPDGHGGYTVPESLHGASFSLAGGLYTFRDKYGLAQTFDSAGCLVERRDRNDNFLTFVYDGDDRLTGVIDGHDLSRRLTLGYSGDRLASLTDFAGRTWTYGYTGTLLASATTPADANTPALTTQYTYYTDAARQGLLEQVIQADGGVVHYAYYANRRGFQVTDPEGYAHSVSYNVYRKQSTFLDERGYETVYTYNDAGNLVETQYADGAAESWAWADYLKTSHTDAFGLTETYTYDALGNLTSLTDRAGQVTTATYEPVYSRRTSSTLPLGQVTTYGYDAAGNLIVITDALGNVTAMTYDARGQLLSVTDPRGTATPDPDDFVTHFTYNGAGQILTRTDALDDIETYIYDTAGNRLAVTDALGYVTSWTYDLLNRQLTATDALGNVTRYEHTPLAGLAAVTDPLGRTTRYEYDGNFRLVQTIDAEHGVWSLLRDGLGNITASTDPLGRNSEFTYDARGHQVAALLPDGASEETHYDAAGRVVATVDPLGQATTYGYDALGRLVAVSDPLSHATTQSYNANGNRITVTDANGNTTTYVYDNLNRLVRVTDALGRVTAWTYDAAGNTASETDAAGRTIDYAYDALNRKLSQTNDLDETITWTYDALGNVARQTDPLGHATTYRYDPLGRMVETVDALGGIIALDYDAGGNLLSLTDPASNATSYTCDDLGRRLSETDALGATQRFTYDAVGNRTEAVDASGRVREFVYDARDRLVQEIWLNGSTAVNTIEFTFDAAGQLIALEDASTAYTFTYDAAGHLLTFDTGLQSLVGSGSNAAYEGVLGPGDSILNNEYYTDPYTFDAQAGENIAVSMESTEFDTLVFLISPSGTYWYNDDGGDGTNSLLNVTANMTGTYTVYATSAYTWDTGSYSLEISTGGYGPGDVVLSYSYDGVDNLLSLADNAGGLVTYAYDAANQRVATSQTGDGVADKRVTFAYDHAGQLLGLTRYADLAGTQEVATTSYVYDPVGRLAALTHSHGPATLAAYGYTWDAASRITQMTSFDGLSNYNYDATDQLTVADHSYQADEDFAYDANGNRTNPGYATGGDNQLLADGRYQYQYDAEGNRVRRTDTATGDVTEYQWDHRNRLESVTRKNAAGQVVHTVRYTYDGLDRRIGKEVDADGAGPAAAEVERFVYDGQHITMVLDGVGDLTYRYLYGPQIDQVLAQEEMASGTVLWALADHQGTVRDLVNSSGAVVNHIQYDSFGQITSQTNPVVDFRFTYTGREFDAESGLYYYRARYYDAASGRFISKDPLRFLGDDTNLYRYTANAPLTSLDPDGLKSVAVFQDKDWDLALILTRLLNANYWFAPTVTGVTDLVTTVTELAGNGKISRLDIEGHGNDQGMMMGSDFVTSGNFAVYEAEFKKLAPYMTDDAVVNLHGCKVGNNQQLLIGLSNALGGAEVRAGTGLQYAAPGIEGTVVVCEGGVCT